MRMSRPEFPGILRLLPIFLGLTVVLSASAQGGFVINGRLKVDGGGLDGSRMVVYRDGVKVRTMTEDLRKFSLPLDLNTNYVLSFEKDGFVTKKLSFNTHAPAAAVVGGLAPFDFVVSLFKQYDGVNTVVFNQPVGMIRFDNTLGDFDYDTDYTKSIQSALDDVQNAVAKKQAEDLEKGTKAEKPKEVEVRPKAKEAAKVERPEQEKASRQAVNGQARMAPAHVVQKPSVRPKRTFVTAQAKEGQEERRAVPPVQGIESSRVEAANTHRGSDPRPKYEASASAPVRHQELIVEPNEVVTIVRLDKQDGSIEYRKVVRKYSGTYYFKDGTSCSKLTFESEALAEEVH